MSQYTVELRKREETIVVEEIIESKEEGPAGLPMMKIKDQHGRVQVLTACDFPSYQWENIKVGTRLILVLKEEVWEVKIWPVE